MAFSIFDSIHEQNMKNKNIMTIFFKSLMEQ